MTSLSDPCVQTAYVAICRELWQQWGRLTLINRRAKLGTAINGGLTSCNLPNITLTIAEPMLSAATWTISFPDSYLANGVTVDQFARGVTTLYHEARHSEQWYRIAQGIACGKFRLPTSSTIPQSATAHNIHTNCKIALQTAQHAYQNRASYPQDMDRNITLWYRSIYGFQRAHRGEVLKHLNWDSYFNNVPDAHFAQYLNLPEEKDAYLVQDEVLARLANQLNMWPNQVGVK